MRPPPDIPLLGDAVGAVLEAGLLATDTEELLIALEEELEEELEGGAIELALLKLDELLLVAVIAGQLRTASSPMRRRR